MVFNKINLKGLIFSRWLRTQGKETAKKFLKDSVSNSDRKAAAKEAQDAERLKEHGIAKEIDNSKPLNGHAARDDKDDEDYSLKKDAKEVAKDIAKNIAKDQAKKHGRELGKQVVDVVAGCCTIG